MTDSFCLQLVRRHIKDDPLSSKIAAATNRLNSGDEEIRFKCVDKNRIKTAGIFQQTGKTGVVILPMPSETNEKSFKTNLRHELIHAYDTAKGADFKNAYHLLCSELRANSLAGNCLSIKDGVKIENCIVERSLRSVFTAFPEITSVNQIEDFSEIKLRCLKRFGDDFEF